MIMSNRLIPDSGAELVVKCALQMKLVLILGALGGLDFQLLLFAIFARNQTPRL